MYLICPICGNPISIKQKSYDCTTRQYWQAINNHLINFNDDIVTLYWLTCNHCGYIWPQKDSKSKAIEDFMKGN